MATTYTTRDGDMLDLIASKFYGAIANRVVEQVLEANPGLADHGALLPAGLVITLPAVAAPSVKQGVRLWD